MNTSRKKKKLKRTEVFIGWSGDRSKEVAKALSIFIPKVLHGTKCFCSEYDILAGDDWRRKLWEHLDLSFFGIFCITHENIAKPWIHFEAGAIECAVRDSFCAFLLEVDSQQLTAPFEKQQKVSATKNETQKLILDINAKSPNPLQNINKIIDEFNAHWSSLSNSISKARAKRTIFPIGGSAPFVGFYGEITPNQLNIFHSGARIHLDIVGPTLSGLLDNDKGLSSIMTALTNGATIRLVYLDPLSGYSDQMHQINKIISEDLREKLIRSLIRAKAIKYGLKDHLNLTQQKADEIQSRFLPAATKLHLYHHIQRADDVLLVSEYSQSHEPGKSGPTKEVLKENNPAFFKFYLDEFERIWAQSRPIENILDKKDITIERSRVLYQIDTVRSIHATIIQQKDEPLALPKVIIVLPYMNCMKSCNNCYTRKSSHMVGAAMTTELFSSVVNQALEIKASCIELSGGGEPLRHPRIMNLLDIAIGARKRGLVVGLLTNGSRILEDNKLLEKIVLLDYVRISHTEEFKNNTNQNYSSDFHEIIEKIVSVKKLNRNSSCRIGAKFLLTNSNTDYLENQIKKLISGTKVDHIKVKSLRSEERDAYEPSIDQIRLFEHKIACLKTLFPNATRDIQIDVKPANVNIDSFKCWINPIMTVIDASGKVFICCNYYDRENDLLIGELGEAGDTKLQHFWGNENHIRKIENIPYSYVCNSYHGVHCRLVHYQDICEQYLSISDINHSLYKGVYSGQEKTL